LTSTRPSRYKIGINLISLAAIALKFVSYLNRFLSFQGYEEMEIEEHYGYRAPLGVKSQRGIRWKVMLLPAQAR
jgi:hypothetical protein